MDETCIHYFTPESKQSSSEWTAASEPRPKRPKAQQSAGKVIASVFWNELGIIFIDYLEKGNQAREFYFTNFMSQVNKNDGKIARITLRIASLSTV